MISSDNRRIAKNTLALYVRMGVTMLVSLFTSRVVLQTLGVEDFGIYNVVGGVVVLFSFLNAAMSSATQRFLNFELGRGNVAQVGRVFSMSMSVHFAIAGAVLLLAETVGLWFLNAQLNIPAERMAAANWVYQFSVASTLLGIMLVPYNATIIAYERMTFYAWASIATTFLRLGIVYLLVIGNADKLVLYAALTFAVGVLMQVVHVAYCRRAFPRTAIYRPFRDKKLFRELVSFSGWWLFGGVANMANSQGINMVVNIFCGVAVNAAMGIANQVNAAVYQFVMNFQTAFSPQITKLYSAENESAFLKLVFRASKFSFFLMVFLANPILINTDFILEIWLGTVPEHTASFVRWIIVSSVIDALASSLCISASATGKIRNYQVIVSSLILTNVPVSILLLWLGYSPVSVIVVRAAVNFTVSVWRIFYLHRMIPYFSPGKYLRCVFGRAVFVSLSCACISLPLVFAMNDGWLKLAISAATTCICVPIIAFFIGFDNEERTFFKQLLTSKFLKNK